MGGICERGWIKRAGHPRPEIIGPEQTDYQGFKNHETLRHCRHVRHSHPRRVAVLTQHIANEHKLESH